MINISTSNKSKGLNGPVTTDMISDIQYRDDALNTTVPVIEQGEEHLAQELLSDGRVIEG
jgi:hypothetical protein